MIVVIVFLTTIVEPESARTCVAEVPLRALSVMVSVPVAAPFTLLAGVNAIPMVQAWPGASIVVAMHADMPPVCNEKFVVAVSPLRFRVALPVFKIENVVVAPV